MIRSRVLVVLVPLVAITSLCGFAQADAADRYDFTVRGTITDVTNPSGAVFEPWLIAGQQYSATFHVSLDSTAESGLAPGAFRYDNEFRADFAEVSVGSTIFRPDATATSFSNVLQGKDDPIGEDSLVLSSIDYLPSGDWDVWTFFGMNQPTTDKALTDAGFPLSGIGLNDIAAWSNAGFSFNKYDPSLQRAGAFHGTIDGISTSLVKDAAAVPESSSLVLWSGDLICLLPCLLKRGRGRPVPGLSGTRGPQ